MKKFSKLRPVNIFNDKDDVVYDDDHLKIVKYEDWSIVKEKDCVFCIPYLIESNQFILRHEYIPTFKYVDGQEYHITLVGGGIELGESPEVAMIRELQEETGIVLREDFTLEPLKPLFISKGLTTKAHLYIIPLNERDYHLITPTGDGSKLEKKGKPVTLDMKYINSLNTSDIMTDYMILQLKKYLS